MFLIKIVPVPVCGTILICLIAERSATAIESSEDHTTTKSLVATVISVYSVGNSVIPAILWSNSEPWVSSEKKATLNVLLPVA